MTRPAVLVVTAHPDDECLLGGGVLAACSAAGVATGVVCLTRGEQGPIASPGLASVTNHEVRLLDWQRGQILWRLGQPAGSNPGDYYVFALPRPGGTDFMVGVAVRAAGTGDYPAIDQLWQVRASGAATAVAKGPIYPGF